MEIMIPSYKLHIVRHSYIIHKFFKIVQVQCKRFSDSGYQPILYGFSIDHIWEVFCSTAIYLYACTEMKFMSRLVGIMQE